MNLEDQQRLVYMRTSFPSLIAPVRISGPFYSTMSSIFLLGTWDHIQYPGRSQQDVRARLQECLTTGVLHWEK